MLSGGAAALTALIKLPAGEEGAAVLTEVIGLSEQEQPHLRTPEAWKEALMRCRAKTWTPQVSALASDDMVIISASRQSALIERGHIYALPASLGAQLASLSATLVLAQDALDQQSAQELLKQRATAASTSLSEIPPSSNASIQ